MILFKKIRWKNLLSTGNEFTEILLDKSKTTLIIGENGAGKSTFLDALSFALYGRAFRNINKPQLINTINNSGLMVEAEFRTDGSDWVVCRGVKPDVFEIYRDDKLVDQESSSRDYQAYLEQEVLKMSHKAFKQVVVLGSSDYVPFMALKTNDRREVIEDIIDIQIFTVMAAMLKRRTDKTKDDIRIVGNNLEQLKKSLTIHRDYQSSFEENHAQIVSDIRNDQEDKRSLVVKLSEEIEEHRTLNEQRSLRIADRSNVISSLDDMEKLWGALSSRQSSLKREVEFLRTNDVCPTCTQDIAADFKSDAMSKRSKEILKLIEGLDKVDNHVTSLRNQVGTMTDIANEIRSSQTAVQNLEREILFIERQVEDLERKIEDQENKSSTNTSKGLINDLSVAIRNEARVIEQLYEKNEVHEYATILLKDTGIKARLLKKYIPIINQLINKYLHAMNFFIQFELDENFNETIKSPYRDNFSYPSFSEGEKLRINLAILFTWRDIATMRNSMSTNLLIMDEIFDSSLDDSGVEDFLKILEELTGETNIFVISHKSQMFDKFRGAIRFKKQGNFSKIATDGA